MSRASLLVALTLLACGGVEAPASDEGTSSTSASSSTTSAIESSTGVLDSDAGTSETSAGDSTGTTAADATGEPDPGSRCEVSPEWISCTRNVDTVQGSVVYWQVPVGEPPSDGWPGVVIYHGSFFAPEGTWSGDPSMAFGGFEQLRLQAMLLDRGFAIITPTASADLAWSTNFPGYLSSDDHQLVLALLEAITAGDFGPLNAQRLYATGISSGGYMTSRMAVSYPGVFRALAVHSASYATCTNVLCVVPDPLPDDHPPTLFVHGELDVVTPLVATEAYADQLAAQGLEHEFVLDPLAGHRWVEAAPEAITAWFEAH